MRRGRTLLRWSPALLLAAGLWACQGCSAIRKIHVFTYDRINDTADMIDVGVTVSGKRCLAVYACGAGLFTAGGGFFEGYYVGLGGGRLGVMRHYQKTIGLVLYSYEEYAWGNYDRQKPETLTQRHVGIVGSIFFPRRKQCSGPSWMHTLHVVHVGLMGNAHYMEILDFVLGWLGHDIREDDMATQIAAEEEARKAQPRPPQRPPERVPRTPADRPAGGAGRDARKARVNPLNAQP